MCVLYLRGKDASALQEVSMCRANRKNIDYSADDADNTDEEIFDHSSIEHTNQDIVLYGVK